MWPEGGPKGPQRGKSKAGRAFRQRCGSIYYVPLALPKGRQYITAPAPKGAVCAMRIIGFQLPQRGQRARCVLATPLRGVANRRGPKALWLSPLRGPSDFYVFLVTPEGGHILPFRQLCGPKGTLWEEPLRQRGTEMRPKTARQRDSEGPLGPLWGN